MVCVSSGDANVKECYRPSGAGMVPAGGPGDCIELIYGNDLVDDLVYSSAMAQVGIHEAKTHLSRLLRRVAAGEVIVIAKGGVPLARLVPIHSRTRRDLGRDQNSVVLHDDFDGPMSENPGQP